MSEHRARVVVVDDDVLYLRGLKRALLRRGTPVELVTFVRGDDAVTYLATNTADVVVLDLRMPGLDGLEACKEIKERNPSMWVAIASAPMRIDTLSARRGSHAPVGAGSGWPNRMPMRYALLVHSGVAHVADTFSACVPENVATRVGANTVAAGRKEMSPICPTELPAAKSGASKSSVIVSSIGRGTSRE